MLKYYEARYCALAFSALFRLYLHYDATRFIIYNKSPLLLSKKKISFFQIYKSGWLVLGLSTLIALIVVANSCMNRDAKKAAARH